MVALIGGGIGDADDTDTSADSVAGRRPVWDMEGANQAPALDMDALPDCIRFFQIRTSREKSSKKR